MTVPQWGVLGILFLCICGIAAGGFWWLNSMVAEVMRPPELVIPNVTPPPTDVPLPTNTPTSTASPTPITYESLIPAGWILFPGDGGIEMYFPPSYIAMTDQETAKALPIVSDNEDPIPPLLALKDTTPSPYRVATTFQTTARVPLGLNMDLIADQQFGKFSREGRLMENEAFEFLTQPYEARRLVFDINIGGTAAGLAIYVVYADGRLYYLGFATTFNELYARLPDFDQSVQTFRVGHAVVETPTP